MFTLGTAAKHVGKSKPTISKAIKDGKLSATKVNGVFEIEPSELLRVFPNSPKEANTAPHSALSTFWHPIPVNEC
jgi:excisionase family DNA binding protein